MSLRRLPVYLLLDTSGSMRGEPIEAVKVGVRMLVAALRQDPHALESVHISILTFDQKATVLCPLIGLEAFQMPPLRCLDSGPTHLGEALAAVCYRVDAEVHASTAAQKGDWRPLLFIMTDGSPSDTAMYREWSLKIKEKGFASIIACAAGARAQVEPLRQVADHVVVLDTVDSTSLGAFFQWISSTILPVDEVLTTAVSPSLPPPPPEVHVVL
jgi:uncharacterized protein YegL